MTVKLEKKAVEVATFAQHRREDAKAFAAIASGCLLGGLGSYFIAENAAIAAMSLFAAFLMVILASATLIWSIAAEWMAGRPRDR